MVTLVGERDVTALTSYLDACGLDGDALVVLGPPTPDVVRRVEEFGGAIVLCDLDAWRDTALAERTGVVPGALTVEHELRVRPGPDAGDVAARLDGDVLAYGRLLLVDKVTDDTDVLLTANWHLTDHPVATVRGNVATFGLDPLAHPRLLHRVIRRALGLRDAPPVRVGLLGYGAIGHEHNAAVSATEGLTLAAVCDRNPSRIEAARTLSPDVLGVADADALIDAVDLVIVSTPPNTHVTWAMRALQAGKHVVVEKPFSITTAEADEMLALAAAQGVTLAVYQNRRWDADYLALKRVVRSGAIGDVFHLESFVGGYGHPCNYWHSDEEVSGGAIYDWGSHHLDWTLDLMPQPVEWVSATTHKRVWHDVTNADHSRVTVRFADGAEAEFVHSDLAAALKPKWYVLGTRGAVRGDWRNESVLARDAVGNLAEDALTPAESPARLTVFGADGSTQALAIPPAPRHPFHRELADRIVSGEPMSVTPEGSRRTIAVMEAATLSAGEGGRPTGVR